MNFKAQIERDVKRTFHNSEEFAETTVFYYNGTRYKAPIILDYDSAKDRKKPSADNADGIFLCDIKMYVAFSDIKVVPRKGLQIEIGEDYYKIVKAENENGEIVLYLEMLDE